MFGLVVLGIIISALNAFVYIKLIKCLLFDKYIVKKSLTMDFFIFDSYSKSLGLNNLLLKFIILLVTIFLCLTPFYINDLLNYLSFFSESSFLIVSVH